MSFGLTLVHIGDLLSMVVDNGSKFCGVVLPRKRLCLPVSGSFVRPWVQTGLGEGI